MVVLITGATGLVGTPTVARLREAGHEVVAVGRTVAPLASETVIHDLRLPLDPARLPSCVDAVVHLAKWAHPRDFPASAQAMHAVDGVAAVALASAALERGAKSFVYASSGAAADSGTRLTTSLGFYAAVKRSTELLLAPFADHLALAVLRLYFPFGPQHPCFVRGLAEQIRDGAAVRLGGADGLTINPIAVEDVADCIVAAIDSPATYDIAGPEEVTLRALAARLAQGLGVEARFTSDDAAPARRQVGDPRGAVELLGRQQRPLGAALDALARAVG